jgi:hypothetical protein
VVGRGLTAVGELVTDVVGAADAVRAHHRRRRRSG